MCLFSFCYLMVLFTFLKKNNLFFYFFFFYFSFYFNNYFYLNSIFLEKKKNTRYFLLKQFDLRCFIKKKNKNIKFFSRKIQERVLGDIFLRFLESFFGTRVLFFFTRNLWLQLNNFVFLQESIFSRRINQYSGLSIRKKRGSWWWGSQILALSVYTKDPSLLVSWLQTRLRNMSLYAHRRFFRLLGLLLKNMARIDNYYNFRGFYMRLVGKISVVGNAMSRVWWTRGGFAAGSNLNLQFYQGFTIVNTVTGCLGLTLYFFF